MKIKSATVKEKVFGCCAGEKLVLTSWLPEDLEVLSKHGLVDLEYEQPAYTEMRKICKICGEAEETHHEPRWLEIPDGCVCDWRLWDDDSMTSIPPVCGEYEGYGKRPCMTCEHDKECHK